MRRKIIQHGPSSLTISLPSTWAKEKNLSKGDEIDVFEEEGDLIIKASGEESGKMAEISFSGVGKKAREKMLLALHNKGYDEILIFFDKEKTVKETYAYLNDMHLGFEIIKQDKGSFVIRNVSTPDSSQFDGTF